MSSFCICKSYSLFFSKNTCELDTVLTRTVNILTTKELVKLMMLWKTGPSIFKWAIAPDKRCIQAVFVLFLHKYINCGYSLEVPWQCISNDYPQPTFLLRNMKNTKTTFLLRNMKNIKTLRESMNVPKALVGKGSNSSVKGGNCNSFENWLLPALPYTGKVR